MLKEEKIFKEKISRRNFLKGSMITSTLLALGLGSPEPVHSDNQKKNRAPDGKTGATPLIREAMFYKKLSHDRVECEVCFRRCIIHEGERGECKNKQNSDGKLYNVVWSRPSSIAIDPIEKEPQLHMLPGTYILCFGTAGCNFHCRFCQNWQLSQQSIEAIGYFYPLGPTAAVSEAKKRLIPTLSFTYNEPTSFYEYVYDIAKIAKSQGLNILWHSNGAMNPTPLKELLKYTDAATIDLKGFTDKFYRHYSQGELEAVLQTLKIIKDQGVWLEIVNLVIPTANDDPQDVLNMCTWIKDNLGKEVPLHFSRFFPAYRLTKLPPTPIETLERCYNIAKENGLHYVTIGNVPGHIYNSTFCPECGKILIRRMHFQVMEYKIAAGRCSFCDHPIPGIWKT